MMTHRLFNFACALLILCCAAGAARADIRIKQRMTFGSASSGGGAGRAIESDVAIKGQRQRSEQELAPGMKMVNITQCDLKRTLAISEMSHKYTITPIAGVEEVTAGATPAQTPAPAGRVKRGGVVTFVQTMTDTGERKQMFGYTARHIITKVHTEHSPDACEKDDMGYETDGWYIDLEINFECLTSYQRPNANPMARPTGCQDQMRFRRVGTARLGYPVLVTTRYFGKDGSVQTEMTQEVVSLSRETLDPSLFDVPAGYQLASSQQELFDPAAMMKAMQGANHDNENEGAGSSAGSGGMSASSSGGGMGSMSGATGAKQPGAIRVGVVRVGNKTTQSIDAGNLRSVLIASIMEGSVEAIPLNETAPDAAQAEAKQKSCDYVLFTDVSGLKQSTANKIGGMLGRATGASSGAERYEAKLDYMLVPVAGGAPTQANASAKEDGGADVSVNSALKKEAQAVVAKVRK
jgi:hypothetical protein